MSSLSWLSRQIYDAGVNNEDLQDVRKAALESAKDAVARLSVECAQESASSRASKTGQTSKKRKSGHVYPEMKYKYKLLHNHTLASLRWSNTDLILFFNLHFL